MSVPSMLPLKSTPTQITQSNSRSGTATVCLAQPTALLLSPLSKQATPTPAISLKLFQQGKGFAAVFRESAPIFPHLSNRSS